VIQKLARPSSMREQTCSPQRGGGAPGSALCRGPSNRWRRAALASLVSGTRVRVFRWRVSRGERPTHSSCSLRSAPPPRHALGMNHRTQKITQMPATPLPRANVKRWLQNSRCYSEQFSAADAHTIKPQREVNRWVSPCVLPCLRWLVHKGLHYPS
jgi:hypothetical protein